MRWQSEGGEQKNNDEMAVGVGFEPTEGHPSTVFKTAAFDHSASPPKKNRQRASGGEGALYRCARFDQVTFQQPLT